MVWRFGEKILNSQCLSVAVARAQGASTPPTLRSPATRIPKHGPRSMNGILPILRCLWGKLVKGSIKQGNYSLRRHPKLTIPQAVIGQRWATVNSSVTILHPDLPPMYVWPIYQHSHHHKSNRQKAWPLCTQIWDLCMYDPYTSTHTIIRVTAKKRDHLAPRFGTSVCMTHIPALTPS